MAKFITKSVCMALVAVLCVGSLNAQIVRRSSGQDRSKTTGVVKVASAQSQRAPETRNVIYLEGLEGTTIPNLPTGWTVSTVGKWETLDNYANHVNLGDDIEILAGGAPPDSCNTLIASGAFGENDALSWKLCEDGTLTISGVGAMPTDFVDYGPPWYSDRDGIRSVMIENGVTTVGDYAFLGCNSLASITIPNSVTAISYSAFTNCDGLISIYVDEGNTVYSSDAGVLYNKDKTTLVTYPSGKIGPFTIPDFVTTIGYFSFYKCTNLTAITISNSVKTIEEGAFFQCIGLTSVTIPNNSVTFIGESAFWNCNGLTSVLIPNSVTFIGYDAFDVCLRLTSIEVDPGNTAYSSEAGVLYNKNKTFLHTWPAGKNGTFEIPASVQTIGATAFYYCFNLISITIPNSVTIIGDYAFYYCTGLRDVKVGWNIPLAISNEVFLYVNTSAVTLTVPVNTEYLYRDAPVWKDFGTIVEAGATTACDNPIAGKFGENNALSWTLCEDGTLTISGVGAMPNYESDALSLRPWHSYQDQLKTLVIEEGVTHIGEFAFCDCKGLTGNLIIPNSVTTIGAEAFRDCSGFTGLIIPNSVTSIGSDAFMACSSLQNVTVQWETPLTVPSNIFIFVLVRNITLTVPAGTKALYEAADVWKDFGTIVEEGVEDSYFSAGNGSESDPYIIQTSAQLVQLAELVNAGNTDYNDKYYRLANDIDLSTYGAGFNEGKGWTPIGYFENPFNGNFDGNAKKLTGLYINNTSFQYIGLFGRISGTVKNLGVVDVNINSDYSVGGVVGYNAGNLLNCYSTGLVNTNSLSTTASVGGVVGENIGTVSNCYSICVVSNLLTNWTRIGGVVGANWVGGNVSNCVALNPSLNGGVEWFFFGRIVGYNEGTLTNNIAFSNMLNLSGTTTWNNIGLDQIDGEDITATAILADGTLGGRFTAANGWTTENGKLPGLGAPVDMPKHLQVGETSSCDTPLASGVFGENDALSWKLCPDGTLTISGEGAMPDYQWEALELRPWDSYQNQLKRLVIEEGITSIGAYSLSQYGNLTGELILPHSVTSIGMMAFAQSGITSLTIPENVAFIGGDAFWDCASLATVYFNAINCQTMGSYDDVNYNWWPAFWEDEALHTLVIGDKVTNIPDFAFCGSGLQTVSIPDKVAHIGFSAFSYCSQLTAIDVAATNSYFGSENGVLFDKNKTLLLQCPAGKTGEYIIPATTDNIADYAFYGCEALTNIVIPNHTQSIGLLAFEYAGITELTIPESITSIGRFAFYACPALETVHYNAVNCTIMGYDGGDYVYPVFSQCTSLQKVTIGANVESIPVHAFRNCSGLTGRLFIPNSVTSLGRSAFRDCSGLTSISIPNSVSDMGETVFMNNTALEKVTVYWESPFDISELSLFNQVDVSAVQLIVPAGTQALYQAAPLWKDFGTIREKLIDAEAGEPAGANGEGTINLALEIPTNTLFIGSFYVQLPEGFTINTEKTCLAEALASLLGWSVTQEDGNKWLIEIFMQSLRQSKADVAYTQIMQIIYNVEQSIEDGNYELAINDLNFEFEDGTSIVEDEIPIVVQVDHDYYSGIREVNSSLKIYISDNQLYVNTPQQETIYLYTVYGQLEYSCMKSEGMKIIPLRQNNNQILIVKGSSGWVRKVVK